MYKKGEEWPTLRIQSWSVEADEDDLREVFGRFGKITRANVIRDRDTKESKGFAFVSYESRKDAEVALNKMNGVGRSFVSIMTDDIRELINCRLRLADSFHLLVP